jgi:hypothetical protein
MNKENETMGKKSFARGFGRVYIAYSEERDTYYVGETGDSAHRYPLHRAVHHRQVIADFPASDNRRERANEELELFQFCEAVGLPLENKHRLQWRSKRRD